MTDAVCLPCDVMLQEICSELKVQDVSHVMAAVKARCREADSVPRLEKVTLLLRVFSQSHSPFIIIIYYFIDHSMRVQVGGG